MSHFRPEGGEKEDQAEASAKHQLAIHLLLLGHRYQVSSLIDQCIIYIAEKMVAENALEAISAAYFIQADTLVAFTMDFIHKNRKSYPKLSVERILQKTPKELGVKILETAWLNDEKNKGN